MGWKEKKDGMGVWGPVTGGRAKLKEFFEILKRSKRPVNTKARKTTQAQE